MHPVLFNANATAWTTFGIGVLSSAISCEVEENRNGTYELEMTYPVTGAHYADIALRCLIVAKPNYTDNPQPFRIYNISKPLNGVVTINAQHISYDLSGYIDGPFSATGVQEAISRMTSSTVIYPTSCPFTFSTDLSGTQTMNVKHPTSVRALMGGIEGSLIDNYGGEWHFDGYSCALNSARGANRGVIIRYGKNLTDLRQEENNAAVYTAVYPYYYNGDTETLVTLPEKVVQVAGTFNYTRVMQLDLTSEFNDAPTTLELKERAERYIATNSVGVPKVNLTVSFEQLDTLRDRVDLCDTVSVRFDALGVSATAKCIRTKWDVLKGRYIEAEFGSAKGSLASTIAKSQEIAQVVNRRVGPQLAEIAKKVADKVVGHTGGYIMLHDTDNDDEPDEILIMDSPDISTAVKIIRFSNTGIAFSRTGYNGTYSTAWNIDGEFVADFIASGQLRTNNVKILGDTQFYWDSSNITIVNPSNPSQMIKFGKYDGYNYGLGFSTDGGATWRSGFDFNGISVLGGGSNAVVQISGGTFTITRTANTVYLGDSNSHDENGTEGVFPVYRLGTYKKMDRDGNTYTYPQSHGCYCFAAGQINLPAGAFSICMGYDCESIGNYSIVMGYRNTAGALHSIAIGAGCVSSKYTAIALGYYCTASDSNALAIGNADTASGSHAVAIGNSNTSSGTYAISIGANNESTANSSVVFGRNNKATKNYSFVVGYKNEATGQNTSSADATCIAIGWGNKSLNNCAVAIGANNVASGSYAFALGHELSAPGNWQFVCGAYNIPRTNKYFIIGNGNSSSTSNSLEVDSGGNMWIAGTLTQSSDRRLKNISGKLPDVSGIRAVRFRWNEKKHNGDSQEHIGYIAQDVEEKAPYLVQEDETTGYKSLDYIALLCAKVDQLERTVEALTNRIKELEAKC